MPTQANALILNGTVSLGSDTEKQQLAEYVANIRAIGVAQNKQQFDLFKLCKQFEDSDLWRLYGTWTFARVLKEECGVKMSEYEAYKTVLQHVDHDRAASIGMPALRAISRALGGLSDDESAVPLLAQVEHGISAYTTEHGFSPTKKASAIIVQKIIDRMGLGVPSASKDGLRKRYQWLIATLKQIESLSGGDSAVGAIARNALSKVGAKGAVREASHSVA